MDSFDDVKPHFVLLPFMAQGHMIPMIDFAHLLAGQGALVSVITTPFNASRIKTTINRARASGLPIRFAELPFPCSEFGLPDGCENIDVVPSIDLMLNFFEAIRMLQQPLEKYLTDHPPYPSCIIADLCHPWSRFVAKNLQVPRLTFFSICCFTLLSTYNIWHYKIYEHITDATEPFDIPGLPQTIKVTKAQAPGWFSDSGWGKMAEEVREAEFDADGIVANTFNALEMSYIESYANAMGKKVWAVGPFSLRNKDISDMVVRGNTASIDVEKCLSWLDSMQPRSVVYVSFGSLTHIEPQQLKEIGLGLEESGRPFVWVIKNGEWSPDVESWLAGGFEERMVSRGLIIRGWAPQVAILSHKAVGGFMTHCGWNSTLEGVAAGVPMITWPHFADQFLNERFVVDVVRIAVSLGVQTPVEYGVENCRLFATREEVERAVRRVMDSREEGEERRKRAQELGNKAREAMREGGTSHANLTDLIQYFS